MVQIMLTMAVLLGALYVGFCVGYVTAEDEFELKRNEPAEPENPTFTYCMNRDIKEAFQISEGYLPTWAIDDNIDIQISPEMKVVVHKENGYNVIAKGSDYLVKDADGDFFCCPEVMFDSNYSKIEV